MLIHWRRQPGAPAGEARAGAGGGSGLTVELVGGADSAGLRGQRPAADDPLPGRRRPLRPLASFFVGHEMSEIRHDVHRLSPSSSSSHSICGKRGLLRGWQAVGPSTERGIQEYKTESIQFRSTHAEAIHNQSSSSSYWVAYETDDGGGTRTAAAPPGATFHATRVPGVTPGGG